MNSTMTDEMPPTGPSGPAARPRLERSTDRRIAGVAGGLADYFAIDPVLVRVAFVVSVFLGGFGLVAYLALWIAMPVSDGSSPPHPSRASRRPTDSTTVVAVVLIVAAVIVLGGPLFFGAPVLAAALLIGGGVWLLNQPPRDEEVPSGPGVPPASPPSPPPPGYGPPHPPAAPHQPAAPPPPDRPRRRVSVITPAVLSLLAIAGGVMLALQTAGAVRFSPVVPFAVGLLIVGGGLVLSAFRGRATGLIPLGLLLAVGMLVATVVGPALGRGLGDRYFEPVAAAELEPRYELGMGRLLVDLRRLDLDDDASVEVELEIGELIVVVPEGVNLEVDAKNRMGELVLFERRRDGLDNRLSDQVDLADGRAPTLVLRVDGGIGSTRIGFEDDDLGDIRRNR